jgi:CPA2 family monovalent cation:H+ antiporter-2/glutathione-regulated potassium-efflux system ancillary protein KefC
VLPAYQGSINNPKEDNIDEQAPVIIAGIGRFGQIVTRFLKSNGINTIVLDHSSAIIEKVKSIKMKAYYGDATRPDLLHTAGIDAACMLIIAIDDKEKAVELVRYVKHHRPALKVFARAYDRGHRYELQAAGADEIVVETYYSALTLAAQALQQTGVHPFKVEQNRHKFREIEHRNHQELYTSWLKNEDEAGLGIQHRDLFIQLEQALDKEMLRTHHTSDDIEAWRPPPKEYGDNLKGET